MSAKSPDPFYSPVTGFSDALIPLLVSFEKTKIETTLRGFIARADSFPGFRQSETEPSEYGIYLNVAVCDPVDLRRFSDHTEQKGALTHRLIQIPPPKGGEQAIIIQLDYGRKVSTKVIRTIDKCIAHVISFSKRSTKS